MVFGPPIHSVTSLDALNTSSGAIYSIMKPDGSSKKEGVQPTGFPAWADVRNVADAHYEVIAKGKSGRYLVSNGVSASSVCAIENSQDARAFWLRTTF